jgi:hypothetical protein
MDVKVWLARISRITRGSQAAPDAHSIVSSDP